MFLDLIYRTVEKAVDTPASSTETRSLAGCDIKTRDSVLCRCKSFLVLRFMISR